jgi:hypothetical protein
MSGAQGTSLTLEEIDFTSIRRRDLTEARLQGFLTAWANLGAVVRRERRKETVGQLRARAERVAQPEWDAESVNELRGRPHMQDVLKFISRYRDLLAHNAIEYQNACRGIGSRTWHLGFAGKVASFGENLAAAWECEHAQENRLKPLESKAVSLRALRIIHLFSLVSELSFVGNESYPQLSPEEIIKFNPAQQLGDPVIVSLLYMLRKERKFRLCALTGCETPFFVAERGSTRYCCVSCSDQAAKASDLKYYENTGAELRRTRLGTKARPQSRAMRRQQ